MQLQSKQRYKPKASADNVINKTDGNYQIQSYSKDVQLQKGYLPAIPAVIIKEIPFPIPRSVICSPSHIKNIVPVTRQIRARNRIQTGELLLHLADRQR